jgi:hypothetical protein
MVLNDTTFSEENSLSNLFEEAKDGKDRSKIYVRAI